MHDTPQPEPPAFDSTRFNCPHCQALADQVWLDEAERRLAAYRRGETMAMPGDVVFGELLRPAP